MKFSPSPVRAAETTSTYPPRNFIKHQTNHAVYRAWLLFGGFLAAYGIVFGLWQVEPIPFDVHILGILVAGFCFFPLTKWIAEGCRSLPMFELVCVAYWMAFGLPVYTQTNSLIILSKARWFTSEQTFYTLCIVLLGIGAFILGYYGVNRARSLKSIPKLDLPLNSNRFMLYAKVAVGTGAVLIGMSAADIELPAGGLAAFSRLLFSQIYIAIILLAYRVYGRSATWQEARLLWFAVAVAVLYGLAQGMLEVVLIPLLLVFIVRWHVTRKLPVVWLVIGMVLFFLLNSVKGEYRTQTWYSNDDLTFSQRIGLWLDLSQSLAQETVEGQPSDDPIPPWQRSLQRFDLLHQFIHVREMTPHNVPYFEGSTYSYLFYGWIPRFLWPDKPSATVATDTLAVQYQLMTEELIGRATIGTGLLPEAYANFGVWGVAPIMALQGMFLAVINLVLNGPRSEGGRAIYLSIMIFFLNGIGSQTAILFSSIIPAIIGSALIMKPFVQGWSASSSKPRPRQRHAAPPYSALSSNHKIEPAK